jgi:NSS family neurotransmitter:Na+ symporter
MKRDGFSSQFGALMALVGSAVGLGNLWKFPYMAGKHGGAAFILIYIGFLFLLCLPLMLSEFIIGRRSEANAVGAFRKLAPGSKWYLTGVTGVLTAFVILSFYCVVGGWCIQYLWISVTTGFSVAPVEANQFYSFVGSAGRPIMMHLIFLGMTVLVLWTGVKSGIEKYSNILMPVLFLLVVILAGYSLTLPNARQGVDFLLKPDFQSITPGTILDALGQGLFSLSLGMGAVITYSSYMKRSDNLTQSAIITIVMDLVFALLAGFVILPAVFAFGFQPDEGPGLLFIILPEVFARMPLGGIFALLFFVVLIIAALTSSISLLEVVTAYLTEEKGWSRKKALILSGITISVTGALCSLSLGVFSDIKLFGNTIFDFFDLLSSSILMPIGAFFISIFVGWKMKCPEVFDELSNSQRVRIRLFGIFHFLIRYFVPLAIIVIFLNKLGILGL